jgi:polyferredoxin
MTELQETKKPVSSRQNIRKWILIVSFLLVPVTIFSISPIILMMGAAEGIATGSMILLILLFVLSFVVARLWCGYLCPSGGLQEIFNLALKRPLRTKKLDWLKYLVFIGIYGSIAIAICSAGGLKTVDLLYRTQNGISILAAGGIIAFLGPVIIITIFVLIFGKRGMCHTFCPIAVMLIIGRQIRNLVRWPALHLEAEKDRCIDCKKCTKQCPMSLDVNDMVRQGTMEQAECILCGSCVDTCPKGVISYAWMAK